MEYWIQQIAQWIGYLGVGIVIIGVINMTIKLIISIPKFNDNSQKLRDGLMRYLELSLDFFIAKDIINLSIENRDYSTIIQIVIIIGVRIFLTYFIHLEENRNNLFIKNKKGKN